MTGQPVSAADGGMSLVQAQEYAASVHPESNEAAAFAAFDVEIARLHEAAAQALANQAKLKGMSVEDGAALLELESSREIVIAWVWAARQMLGDAPNYSETRIDFPSASMEVKAAGEVDRYVFTVQRAGKVTPHEARTAAEAEAESLRAELERLREQQGDVSVLVHSWRCYRQGERPEVTRAHIDTLLDNLARAHEEDGTDD